MRQIFLELLVREGSKIDTPPNNLMSLIQNLMHDNILKETKQCLYWDRKLLQ